MNLIKRIFGGKSKIRSFAAAKIGRLTSDWVSRIENINRSIRGSLTVLFARSIDKAKNSAYMKKYLNMRAKNIIGHNGIRLQCNDEIESAWIDWGKSKNCCVDGRKSWVDIQKLLTKTKGCYGESFLQLIVNEDSKYNFQVKVLNPQLCDISLNVPAKSAGENEINMGVELNADKRPIAYYFKSDSEEYHQGKHLRVEAQHIIHDFEEEFPGQVRGIPKVAASLLNINRLDGYNEAVLINARVSAAKMGFIIPPEDLADDDEEMPKTDITSEVESGTMELLPQGYDVKFFDPKQPTAQHAMVVKAELREIASGLDVCYHELANDLEGVSFSSIRSGTLAERDAWKMEQTEFIEHICDPVYESFMSVYIFTKHTKLPPSKLDKFLAVLWIPRAFPWVDPYKDAMTNKILVEMNVKTLTAVCIEIGTDFETVCIQKKKEKDMLKQYGLEMEEIQEKVDKTINNKDTSNKKGDKEDVKKTNKN